MARKRKMKYNICGGLALRSVPSRQGQGLTACLHFSKLTKEKEIKVNGQILISAKPKNFDVPIFARYLFLFYFGGP